MAHLLHWVAPTVTSSGFALDTPLPAATWREQALALSLLPGGRGTQAARRLKELTDASPSVSDEDLLARVAIELGIPPFERKERWSEAMAQARDYLERRATLGLELLTSRDEAYPSLLRHVADPPIVLWTKGSQSILSNPCVAIVGSRAATPMSLVVARRLARELAELGIAIVSGMARGVDGAAHEGALEAGGHTVAVLGSGADIVYPKEHASLAARIASEGLLVTEYPPGTRAWPGHFPMRNRIISGVARAVVVVEASERSGSLITARMALEQGREVLAVPGNVLSGRSRGCHLLIRDGATIVETAADVIEQLGWVHLRPPITLARTNSLQLKGLEETMAAGEPYSVEDLATRTGRPIPELLAELGALELAGRIVRAAGARYLRLD